MEKHRKIRIMIADDHRIFREGLRALIEKEKDMEVVAEAENGHKAVQLAAQLSPELVVMDIAMPVLNGIEATQRIKEKKPAVRVIILSSYSYKRFLTDAFNAGASGYLLKEGAFDEMIRAVHAVTMDKVYVSPQVAGTVVQGFVSRTKASTPPVLSPREREVLQLIAEGKSTKQIAAHLKVSVKTAETHRHNIMRKLEIYNVPGLTKYAIREGIVFLD
ncbi:MAG: response regulator [Endomicrobiales bacterium]